MARTAQTVPPRQMETRASNKFAHPGNIIKAAVPRRTSAQVQEERDAKAQADEDREEAKRQSVIRAAKFERADMANEDIVDMTPRPPFTPKPWPPPRNRKAAELIPIAESADVEMGDEFDAQSFAPALPEEESVTEDESAVESDTTPRPKKQKAQAKNIREVEVKSVGGKVAAKRKKVDRDEEIVPASDDELIPRPKKVKVVKVPVRDGIDMAAKKIVENEVKGNKYSGMVKTMFGKPALGAPSQLQAAGGKRLKREGAIADINALYRKVTPTNADQTQSESYALKRSQPEMEDINDVMNVANRY
jgi:hypothetical protein